MTATQTKEGTVKMTITNTGFKQISAIKLRGNDQIMFCDYTYGMEGDPKFNMFVVSDVVEKQVPFINSDGDEGFKTEVLVTAIKTNPASCVDRQGNTSAKFKVFHEETIELNFHAASSVTVVTNQY